MSSWHGPVRWISPLLRRYSRLMVFSAVTAACLFVLRLPALGIILNNRGSTFLDRALLAHSEPGATADLLAAGTQFQTALRYQPRAALPYYNLGTIYIVWDDASAGAEAFARATVNDPGDRLAHFQRGLAQAANGDEAAARLSWRNAGAASFFIRRAKANLKAGDVDAGELDARRALDIDPADAQAHYALAEALVQQQEYDSALQIYWAAPDRAESYFRAGKLLRSQGRITEATMVLQEVLDEDPNHVGARFELGRIFVDAGACDRAYVWLAPALKATWLHTPESRSYILMGRCLLGQDDPLAALPYLSEAVALDRKSVDARWLMGQAYEAVGYLDAAADMYRQAVRLRPDYEPARKALEALGQPVP